MPPFELEILPAISNLPAAFISPALEISKIFYL